ncbi:MAG TPA: outer membrane beta-barrel protein, partial [Longimicrobium sp.]|nr:outer membrane beta-barrel protein [Longimicrobium sp.]
PPPRPFFGTYLQIPRSPMCTPHLRVVYGYFGSGVCRALSLVMLFALSTPAAAQLRQGVASTELGVGGVAARPSGDFRQTMGDGYGVGLRSVQRLNAARWLGLRMDGGLLLQSLDRDSVPNALDGANRVDRVTSNTLLYVGLGPQVGVTRGPVRPYAHLFGGVHYLVTESAYETQVGSARLDYGARSFEDAAWSYGGGAGVYVPLGRGRRAASLDLGATWRFGGEATFLKEDVVQIGPDLLTGEFISGRTDMLVVYLGLAFGGR